MKKRPLLKKQRKLEQAKENLSFYEKSFFAYRTDKNLEMLNFIRISIFLLIYLTCLILAPHFPSILLLLVVNVVISCYVVKLGIVIQVARNDGAYIDYVNSRKTLPIYQRQTQSIQNKECMNIIILHIVLAVFIYLAQYVCLNIISFTYYKGFTLLSFIVAFIILAIMWFPKAKCRFAH